VRDIGFSGNDVTPNANDVTRDKPQTVTLTLTLFPGARKHPAPIFVGHGGVSCGKEGGAFAPRT
jgi:hypothetical protein